MNCTCCNVCLKTNILLCGIHVVLLRKLTSILFLQLFEHKPIPNVSWKLCCTLKENGRN